MVARVSHRPAARTDLDADLAGLGAGPRPRDRDGHAALARDAAEDEHARRRPGGLQLRLALRGGSTGLADHDRDLARGGRGDGGGRRALGGRGGAGRQGERRREDEQGEGAGGGHVGAPGEGRPAKLRTRGAGVVGGSIHRRRPFGLLSAARMVLGPRRALRRRAGARNRARRVRWA